jgi:hypothetical protein
MMLLALNREGMAGVCGVCGDIGFPGDDAVDTDVPAIIGGTLDSWRLEDVDERWSIIEEERESDRAACESFRRWYLESWAVVLRMLASFDALSLLLKLLRSFFCSSSLRKSEMFSSSVFRDPELPPGPSLTNISEPGCCDEVALPFPLLILSSSVLLPPPCENLLRLWPKLLL